MIPWQDKQEEEEEEEEEEKSAARGLSMKPFCFLFFYHYFVVSPIDVLPFLATCILQ